MSGSLKNVLNNNKFHITDLQFIHTASTAASAGPLRVVGEDSIWRRILVQELLDEVHTHQLP